MSQEKKITFELLDAINYGDLKSKFTELGVGGAWKGGKKKADLINKALGMIADLKLTVEPDVEKEEEVVETEVIETEAPIVLEEGEAVLDGDGIVIETNCPEIKVGDKVEFEEEVETELVSKEHSGDEVVTTLIEKKGDLFLQLEDTPPTAIMNPNLEVGLNDSKPVIISPELKARLDRMDERDAEEVIPENNVPEHMESRNSDVEPVIEKDEVKKPVIVKRVFKEVIPPVNEFSKYSKEILEKALRQTKSNLNNNIEGQKKTLLIKMTAIEAALAEK